MSTVDSGRENSGKTDRESAAGDPDMGGAVPIEHSFWSTDPDPGLPDYGRSYAEQVIFQSNLLAMKGRDVQDDGPPDWRWPWYYVSSPEPLVSAMVHASGLARERCLGMIAPDDRGRWSREQFAEWPTGLRKFLQNLSPQKTALLATGSNGADLRVGAEEKDIQVPWLTWPVDMEIEAAINALHSCLQRLKERHSCRLDEESLPVSVVPLAACAAFRPDTLMMGVNSPKLSSKGVRRAAIAVIETEAKAKEVSESRRKISVHDVAAQAQMVDLIHHVGLLQQKIEKVELFGRNMNAQQGAHPLMQFLRKPSAASLQQALAVVQDWVGVWYPRVWNLGWGKVKCRFLDALCAAGKNGLSVDEIKEVVGKPPSILVNELVNSPRSEAVKIGMLLKSLRDKHNNGRYYLYRQPAY